MKKNNGFTLIEILITLIILAMAFSGSYFILNTSIQQFQNLKNKTLASWVGLNVIANTELGILSPSLQNPILTGQETLLNTLLDWQLTVDPTPNPNELMLTIKVNLPNQKNILTLNGYTLKKAYLPDE